MVTDLAHGLLVHLLHLCAVISFVVVVLLDICAPIEISCRNRLYSLGLFCLNVHGFCVDGVFVFTHFFNFLNNCTQRLSRIKPLRIV